MPIGKRKKMLKPPHDDETERSVLSDILQNEDAMPIAEQIIGHKVFYWRNHQIVFWAIQKGGQVGINIAKNMTRPLAHTVSDIIQTPVPGSLRAACEKLKELSQRRTRIKALWRELEELQE